MNKHVITQLKSNYMAIYLYPPSSRDIGYTIQKRRTVCFQRLKFVFASVFPFCCFCGSIWLPSYKDHFSCWHEDRAWQEWRPGWGPGGRPHLVIQAKDNGGLARVVEATMKRSVFWICERREELRMSPRFLARGTKVTSVLTHPCILRRQALNACCLILKASKPAWEKWYGYNFQRCFFFHERDVTPCSLTRKEDGKRFLKVHGFHLIWVLESKLWKAFPLLYTVPLRLWLHALLCCSAGYQVRTWTHPCWPPNTGAFKQLSEIGSSRELLTSGWPKSDTKSKKPELSPLPREEDRRSRSA